MANFRGHCRVRGKTVTNLTLYGKLVCGYEPVGYVKGG